MKIPFKVKNFLNWLLIINPILVGNREIIIRRLILLFSLFTIILFTLNSILKNYKEETLNNTISNLQTNLKFSQEAIKNIWIKNLFNKATNWASDDYLIQNTKTILKIPRNSQALLNSKALKNLRTYFNQRLYNQEVLGVFVISPNFVSLASMSNLNIGTTNVISLEHKDRLKKVFKGYNQIIPPIVSDIPLPDINGNMIDELPTMFIVVPIKDFDGSIIAALSLRLDPLADFTKMGQINEYGTSAETYMVSNEGKLLSESRFTDDLHSKGILEKGKNSILNIEVRDPGVNLLEGNKPSQSQAELPFTYALQQALNNEPGFSNVAYRDYRGVLVFGAWLWDKELDIGFISEIDKDEVLSSYKLFQSLVIGLSILVLFVSYFFNYLNLKAKNSYIKIIEQKGKYSKVIIDNAIDGFIVIDKKGIIESFNKSASRIFGYTEQEVIGKNVSMLANEHDRKRHDQYINNYNKTRKPKIIGIGREVIGARKDGALFPMRLGISEALLNDKIVFIGIVQDLSKEKANEKLIQETQERFELTFKQAPLSIVKMNLNYRFIRVNAAFSNLFGFSEKELLTMGLEDLTVPDDIKETKKKLELLQKGSLKILLEKQCIKKNKEKIWVKVSISPFKDKEDALTGYIATLEDISLRIKTEQELLNQSKELKHTNEALVKSKRAALSMMQDANIQKERAKTAQKKIAIANKELKKLTLAIKHSNTIIMITDNKSNIDYVNPAFTKLLGYTYEEAVGSYHNIINSDFHTKGFDENIDKIIFAGDTWKGDIINKKKSGEECWLSTSISPIYNNDNELINFVILKEDISERKQLEEKLIKSKEVADKANKAKSSFLANMSHEIRTPMNAILGFTEILTKQVIDSTHSEYLESIQTSGKTLLTLINDILDLSKIESGKFTLNYEPSNIKMLVQDVFNMLLPKAEEKGLQLNIEISDSIPKALIIDELRIKQILINLINNAIKFTDQGFVEIEITTQNASADYLDLMLKIKDTGIGISKKNHKKIFQEFDQMDMQDNKKYEGTGLGLAITRQLVHLMNGKIDLISEEGKGSIFIVVLEKVKTSMDEIRIKEEKELDVNSVQFENATVLIVDDIKVNRDLLKEYIMNYNINTIEAKNGKEALIAIKKHNPDLVFLDLRMPIMDGFETNKAIMKNPNWTHIPVIAITASVFNKDENKVIAKGFKGYIRKPTSVIDVVKILKKHLKHTVVNDNKEIISKIKFEPIDKLEDLLLDIEKNIMPIYEDIKKIRQKKKVLLLANQLIEIGKKYNATQIINYGKKLQSVCQSFNIVEEKKWIQQFPDFLKNLNT